MLQPEIAHTIEKLMRDYGAGALIIRQAVNHLYDLERENNLAPAEIAEYITEADIKDNYLSITRKQKQRH